MTSDAGAIRIEFRLSEREIAESGAIDPARGDPVVLHVTCYMAPFRIRVHDVELLPDANDAWCELPLLGFACGFLGAVLEARRDGKGWCMIDCAGDFTFRSHGDSIRWTSTGTQVSVVVDAAELEASARCLHARARDELALRVPELRSNPAWPEWFPG